MPPSLALLRASGGSNDDPDQILTFNLVFAVRKSCAPALKKRYQLVAKQLSFALTAVQADREYLSHELARIQRCREEWLSRLAAAMPAAAEGEGPAGEGREQESESVWGRGFTQHEELTLSLLGQSTLARTMQQVFEQLAWCRASQVSICSSLALSLSLKAPECHSRHPLRPYQTFLFADDPRKLFCASPETGPFSLATAMVSSALKRFVGVCSPLKSFADIQIETGLPLSHLYRIAAHLSYWGCGSVIDKVNMEHLLVLNLRPQQASLAKLRLEFTERFGTSWHSLDVLLSFFAVPSSLRALRQKVGNLLQPDFREAFVWMLMKSLLRRANKYYFLLVPDKFAEIIEDGEASESDETHQDPSAPSQAADPRVATTKPLPLTAAEERYLTSISDASDLYAMFYRLCPYFKGHHSLQEIIWRESITPQQLEEVVRKYASSIAQVDC